MQLWKYICSILLLSLGACQYSDTSAIQSEAINERLQYLIDSIGVKGSILIYDAQREQYYTNDDQWAKEARLPASTFKIPNSLIALETGVIENDSSIILWDGVERDFEAWNQDLTFRQAFHYSCVPCYQDIARKIGVDQMQQFTKNFQYGQMDINAENIDNFWLMGNSKISQYQQIDFLKRLHEEKLKLSSSTYEIFKRMMIVEQKAQYTLRGKSGWSNNDNQHNGWYVGYITKNSQTVYFATNITPGQATLAKFRSARKELTLLALNSLQYLD